MQKPSILRLISLPETYPAVLLIKDLWVGSSKKNAQPNALTLTWAQ